MNFNDFNTIYKEERQRDLQRPKRDTELERDKGFIKKRERKRKKTFINHKPMKGKKRKWNSGRNENGKSLVNIQLDPF